LLMQIQINEAVLSVRETLKVNRERFK